LQLINQLKLNDKCQKKIIDLTLTHAMLAEKISPGSFKETIKIIFSSFSNSSIKDIDNKIESRAATRKDVDKFLSHHYDNVVSSIVNDAINLAGYGGKIIIEKSTSNVSSVELCRGYTFEVTSPLNITVRLEKPRLCVIDGYIESVSEIHHILEFASEKKDTLVIFARGFSNDVLHTLKINYDRGTLKVIPVIVNFDLEGINSVNDISVVSGANLVSSNKGDLISAINYDNIPFVDNVLVYPNKIVIQNSSTFQSVNSHINFLKNKRIESVDDVQKLLDKRIRSLSPNHVVIRIPDGKDFVITSQLIDNCLRTIKSITDYGVYDVGSNIIPATTHVISTLYAKKCVDLIKSINTMIYID